MRNKMEQCYSTVDIETRPGGIWGLRPLDMAEVVVMVIFFIWNSVLKRLFTFRKETRFTCKVTLGVLWRHWEIGLFCVLTWPSKCIHASSEKKTVSNLAILPQAKESKHWQNVFPQMQQCCQVYRFISTNTDFWGRREFTYGISKNT